MCIRDRLNPGSGLSNDARRLATFRHKYYPDEEKELKDAGFKWEGNKPPVSFGLQPLKASHTDTRMWGGSVEPVNPKTIWILLSIACLLYTSDAADERSSVDLGG